jgi:hypothetical protein
MRRAEPQVVEVARRDSVNGYEYEHGDSLTSVKEIQHTHQQRIDWWHARADVKADADAP